MESKNKLDLKFKGRDDELEDLIEIYHEAVNGSLSTVLISGEAGVGKTRLVDELISEVSKKDEEAELIRGWCLPDTIEPLMSVRKALRNADLQYLISEEPPPKVLSVYLMNNSGLLLNKAEREESGLDSDIFASMLSAVENFVSDSLTLAGQEQEGSSLNSIGYGSYNILIQSTEDFSLSAVIDGTTSEFLLEDMNDTLGSVDKRYQDWDGDIQKTDELLPKLKWFIESGKYDGEYLVDDPKLKQENLFDNLLLGLQRLSEEHPLLFFIDDIQWADSNTLLLLHYLSRNLEENRILLIGTYRPEDVFEEREARSHQLLKTIQNMRREGLFEELELNRLDRSSCQDIVSSFFENMDTQTEFMDKIYHESEGNPLFLIEVLQMLVAEGYITEEDGSWKLSKPMDKIDLPSKVYDVIERRLDRLKKEQRDLLDWASVVGEEFTSDILNAVSDQNKMSILKSLNNIENSHNIIHYDERKYRFDHSKMRDILYGSIGGELRQEYHRMIAQGYQELYEDDEETIVDELAHHFYRAQDGRAVTYMIEAAENATESYANDEAIKLLTDSLSLIEEDKKVADVRTKLGDLYFRKGEFEGAVESYEEAVEHEDDPIAKAGIYQKIAHVPNRKGEYKQSRDICDKGLSLVEEEQVIEKSRLLRTKGWTYLREGDHDTAEDIFDRSLNIAEELGDEKELGEIYHSFGTLYFSQDQYQRALENFDRSKRYRERVGDPIGISKTLNNEGNVYDDLGELDKARECYEESLRLAKKIGDKYTIAATLNNLGIIHWFKGEFDKVLECQEESLEMFKKIGDMRTISILLNNIGNIYQDRGELDKALENYQESLKIAEDMKNRSAVTHPLTNIGLVYMDKRKHDEALPYFERSLKMSLKNKEKHHSVTNRCGLTEAYLSLGQIENAREHAEEGLRTSEEISSKTMIGKSKLYLGMVCRSEEDLDTACSHLQDSI
ncbi:MAG: tetratricopeptide repeat protein, partial [Thermoplasmatota archaeon]